MFKSSYLKISSHDISAFIPTVNIDDVDFYFSYWEFHNININMINCNASLLSLEINSCDRNSSFTKVTSTVNIKSSTHGGCWKFQCVDDVKIADCRNMGYISCYNKKIMEFANSSAILYNILIEGVNFICEDDERCGLVVHHFSRVQAKNLLFQKNKNASISVLSKSMLKMENCTVLDNEANNSVIYGVESIVAITDCIFENNTGFLAGTIFATNYSVLTVNNSSFVHNRGTGNASVIAIYHYGNVSIQNTSYTSNSVIIPVSCLPLFGTVACTYFCFLHIGNCTFHNNQGSSVYIKQNSILVIINSKFENNTSSAGGGVSGINNTRLNISHSIFHGNSAEMIGGAIYIDANSSLVCASSNFSKNFAFEGGGIAVSSQCNATLSDLILNENYISTYFDEAIFTNIQNCMFSKNIEGAILADFVVKLVVENSDFIHNEAEEGGAIFITSVDIFVISHVRFIQNIAKARGGAITSDHVNNIYIDDSIFRDNKASYDGGVLESSYDNVNIRNSNIENNSAEKGSGGVLSITLGTLFMSNCSVKHSYATNGGAIQGNQCDLDLRHCIFENNTADINGGAVSIAGYSLRSFEVTYLNNSASTCGEGNGGAIYVGQGNIYVINSLFSRNYVFNGWSGAISASIKTDVLHIINTTFSYNYADRVGVMTTDGVGEIMLKDSVFIDNVSNFGQIIYVSSSTFIAINSMFHNNSVGKWSSDGCVSLYYGDSSFENCTFTNNYGGIDGGAIYSAQNDLRISTSVFEHNEVHDGRGKDIFLDSNLLTYLSSFKHSHTYNSTEENFKQKVFNDNIFASDYPDDIMINESQYASGKNY